MKRINDRKKIQIIINLDEQEDGEFSVHVSGSNGDKPLRGKELNCVLTPISQLDFSSLDEEKSTIKPGRYIGTDPDVQSTYKRRITVLDVGLTKDQFNYVFDGEDQIRTAFSNTIFFSSLTEVRN